MTSQVDERVRAGLWMNYFGVIAGGAVLGWVWLATTLAGLLAAVTVGTWPIHALRDLWVLPYRSWWMWRTPERVWVDGRAWLNGAWFWAVGALLASVLLGVAVAKVTARSVRGRKRRQGWASWSDVKGLVVTGPVRRRLVVGYVGDAGKVDRLVATERDHSLAIIGPSGSGKTFTGVIPLAMEHQGALLLTIVKTGLLAPTIGARAARGDVYVFDPMGLAPANLKRLAWAPVDAARSAHHAIRAAQTLASATSMLGSSDEFWARQGQDLLAASLYGAWHCGETMADVLRRLRTREFEPWMKALDRVADGSGLRAVLQETADLPDRQASSRTISAADFVRVYEDPRVRAAAPGDAAPDPATFCRSSDTIYVVAPLADQERLAPVLSTLIDVYTAAAMADPLADGRPDLLVILEEAGNVSPLPNLAELLNTGREQGLRLVTVWQSAGQIARRYGKMGGSEHAAVGTILDGHRAVVLYGGSKDATTLEWVRSVVGEGRIASASVREGRGAGTDVTVSDQQRATLAAEIARQVPFGEAVLIYGAIPPVRIVARTPDKVQVPEADVVLAPPPPPPPPIARVGSPGAVEDRDARDDEDEAAESWDDDDGWKEDAYSESVWQGSEDLEGWETEWNE